jgi:hypothetical protein
MPSPPHTTPISPSPERRFRTVDLIPVGRASRRRWTAALAVALGAGGGWWIVAGELPETTTGGLPQILLVVVLMTLALLRAATGSVAAAPRGAFLDEREAATRDAAYRIAFGIFVAVVIAAFAGLLLGSPEARGAEESVAIGRRELVGAATWILAWAAFLPTAVVAWTAPETPKEQPDAAGGRRELTRDLLLAGAIVGAAALAATAGTFVGLFPLLALMLILYGTAESRP